MRNYRIKLDCNNCGAKQFYTLPFKAEFFPYWAPHEFDNEEERLSYFKLKNGEEFIRACSNCGIANLSVEYWELKPVEQQNNSSAL